MEKLEKELDILKAKSNNQNPANPRSPRKDIQTDIEFIADFDIVKARGVNISETGICFELKQDLSFEMKFEFEGKSYQQRAVLVWARRLEQGGYRLGLEFVKNQDDLTF